MFSQVSVCPQSASWILAHCSSLLQCGRYASYWNTFLYYHAIIGASLMLYLLNISTIYQVTPASPTFILSMFCIADDPSVVRSLLSLLFRLTVQEKSVLVLLNELCRDVHTQLGDIDQVTVQGLFTL